MTLSLPSEPDSSRKVAPPAAPGGMGKTWPPGSSEPQCPALPPRVCPFVVAPLWHWAGWRGCDLQDPPWLLLFWNKGPSPSLGSMGSIGFRTERLLGTVIHRSPEKVHGQQCYSSWCHPKGQGPRVLVGGSGPLWPAQPRSHSRSVGSPETGKRVLGRAVRSAARFGAKVLLWV